MIKKTIKLSPIEKIMVLNALKFVLDESDTNHRNHYSNLHMKISLSKEINLTYNIEEK